MRFYRMLQKMYEIDNKFRSSDPPMDGNGDGCERGDLMDLTRGQVYDTMTPLWTEWITDSCTNITLPPTPFAGGKYLHIRSMNTLTPVL